MDTYRKTNLAISNGSVRVAFCEACPPDGAVFNNQK